MKFKKDLYETVPARVKEIVESSRERDEKLKEICELLKYNFVNYDWVGVYITGPTKKDLLLGPYLGEPTKHVTIPFGKGVCGQAAENKATIIVSDVSKEENYLACSSSTKSEIVVPIIKDEQVVAQIDIDSNILSAFTEDDRSFLEQIAKNMTPLF
jgi:GAF domain-containing protein